MRTTSNPAFRNLPGPGSGGYATFGNRPPAQPGYGPAGAPPLEGRPMTVDDVVSRTGIMLAIMVATGAAAWIADVYALALPAGIVGLVLALVIIFKKSISPPLIMAYAAVEGVFLGAISRLFNEAYEGVVIQAVIGSAAVFGGMLIVYKTGAVRVTPRFQKWMMGALIGVVGLMVVNLFAGLFTDDGLGLRDGGPIAIIFSLVCIGVAAFSFLLDFDAADQMIRVGAPEIMSWRIAFGLTVTLVWLYLEMLRLMSYLQGGD